VKGFPGTPVNGGLSKKHIACCKALKMHYVKQIMYSCCKQIKWYLKYRCYVQHCLIFSPNFNLFLLQLIVDNNSNIF